MTLARLALASLTYYRRTHLAVVLGVAVATAVLSGSFLVGASVRSSLESIATSRLGRTSVVVAAQQPFTELLADRLAAATGRPTTPMLALSGVVRHESSSKRASDVQIYGVDERFFRFHGSQAAAPAPGDVLVSPDLAREVGAVTGDALVLRLTRPTDIPIDSLLGRRDEAGRSIRLHVGGVVAREAMGDFSLAPGQGPTRTVFVALSRLQRDLEMADRANTILLAGSVDAADVRSALARAVTNDDLGIRTTALSEAGSVVVESAAGLVADSISASVAEAAGTAHRKVTPVLTWLANKMSVGDRLVPYSLVSALGPEAGDAEMMRLLSSSSPNPPIVLNAWVAQDLGAHRGDPLTLEYYRWADEGRLVTDRATFDVAGTIPMSGLAIDRRLAPDYPGITMAANVADWDPPFPIDLRLVRKQDEAYWDQYRTAPKAFIPLAAGQAIWKSKYGRLTSLRVAGTEPLALAPDNSSIIVTGLRAQRTAASAGATDFGAYFSYFSFFLMVAALLLAALFFRLGIEQRMSQLGVLRATGFSIAAIRRSLLIEGGAVAVIGAVLGTALAIGWAAGMMFALRTWWIGAVGTTLLTLHLDIGSLAIGAAGALVASLVSVVLAVRSLNAQTPRALLTGAPVPTSPGARSRARAITSLAFAAAIALSLLAVTNRVPASAAFFGAGTCVLIGGLAAFRQWLGRRRRQDAGLASRAMLGMRNAAWRPGRSLTAAGLVAAAMFLLISVDAFRKSGSATLSRDSGTGGFALVAESAVPIVRDLQSPEGRAVLGISSDATDRSLEGVSIFSLRLRPGDDTSCLNLYQPKQPRVLGVPTAFIREARFRFAHVEFRNQNGSPVANPWTLLDTGDATGATPAIVDQTSLQYVLHASVGDTITIDADTSRPISLHIVASLDDSVLQGEILIADAAFQQLFPQIAGYRMFLVEVPAAPLNRADAVSTRLEAALEPFGFDAQSSVARLDAYHRVENTYLSTFQALGGLGLVLGCFGLIAVIARNVLERRRELALLGAAGFTGADLQRVVAAEHLLLVVVGLAIGVSAAAVAVAPVVIARGTAPWHALLWVLPVALVGFAAAAIATRSVRRLPLVASLRNE